MHGLETIRDKDIEKVLNDCQFHKRPFVYWDQHEVKKIDSFPFPEFAETPEGWESYPWAARVDLGNLDEVGNAIAQIFDLVEDYDIHPNDIGFVITDTEEGLITIKAFTSILKEEKSDDYKAGQAAGSEFARVSKL